MRNFYQRETDTPEKYQDVAPESHYDVETFGYMTKGDDQRMKARNCTTDRDEGFTFCKTMFPMELPEKNSTANE